MQRDLIWIPWVMAALILGILICACLLVRALFFQAPQFEFHPGATFVKEAIRHAARL